MTELRREADGPTGDVRGWFARHAAGLACAGLGVLAVAIAAVVVLSGDGALTDVPDPRWTVPPFVAALIAGVAAVVRREGSYAVPAIGVALAASALVFGWAVLIAIIASAVAIVITILSEIM